MKKWLFETSYLRLCLFRCKIFSKVKYFTLKIFYGKYFYFTVFGCISENSFTSVYFKVKWNEKKKKKILPLETQPWIKPPKLKLAKKKDTICKKKKKIRSAKSHKHRFATKKKKKKKSKSARTLVEIYKFSVWQGLAVEICTKQTQIYRA